MPTIPYTLSQNGTELYILAGVPLDNTQTDQLLYPCTDLDTPIEQAQWFVEHFLKHVQDSAYYWNGETGHALLTTQRTFGRTGDRKSNTITVPTHCANLVGCNYMVFRNIAIMDKVTPYLPNKFYFAFIKNVNYVSAMATEIEYEIDVFQTYWFDFNIKTSYIERATVPKSWDEPFNYSNEDYKDIAYYVNKASYTPYLAGAEYFNVFLTNPPEGTIDLDLLGVENYNLSDYFLELETIGGMYSDLYVATFFYDDNGIFTNPMKVMKKCIEGVNSGKVQAITLNRYQIVKYDSMYDGKPTGKQANEKNITQDVYSFSTNDLLSTTFGGNEIQNKKLLSYPYRKLVMISANGQVKELKPELMQLYADNTFRFVHRLSCGNTPTAIIAPDYQLMQPNYSIEYVDGIMCNWNKDYFQIWWSQNKTSFFTNIATSMVGGIASIGKGDAIGGTLQMINSVGGTAGLIDKQSVPDTMSGSMNSEIGSVISFVDAPFKIYLVECDQGSAVRMDRYFNMYGYALDTYMTTSQIDSIIYQSGRNAIYLKLNKPIITTTDPEYSATEFSTKGIPSGDMEKIKTIFSNGVRMWTAENGKIGGY